MQKEKIFIVLGTQKFQLNRLLICVDRLLEEKKIDANVFAQIGGSDYRPKNYPYKDFLTHEEFERRMQECSIVIVHSGVGSIISAIHKNKKVIVYPRLAKYGEHVDDHQCEIAASFAERGLVVCCNDGDSLVKKLEEVRQIKLKPFVSQNDKMMKLITDYIEAHKV